MADWGNEVIGKQGSVRMYSHTKVSSLLLSPEDSQEKPISWAESLLLG